MKRIITVNDINGLYAAVNGEIGDGKGHEDTIVLLSPGDYELFDNNINGGRLELQPGMELHGTARVTGVKGISKQPVIDAKHGIKPVHNFPSIATINGSNLEAVSFAINSGNNAEPQKTGFIIMGRGQNVISDLRIIGNTKINEKNMAIALSAIDTYQLCSGPADITIENTIITGGTSGISIRNAGVSNSKHNLKATLFRNEIYNMSMPNLPAQGVLVQNSLRADNSRIDISMQENYLHDNTTGLRVMNQGTTNSSINVLSFKDKFESNTGNGILLIGGETITVDTIADNNAIFFLGTSISLQGNTGITSLDFGPGQAYIAGAFTSIFPDSVNNNGVVCYLGSPVIEDFSTSASLFNSHISAYGVAATIPGVLNYVGSNNRATVVVDHPVYPLVIDHGNANPSWLPGLGNTVDTIVT